MMKAIGTHAVISKTVAAKTTKIGLTHADRTLSLTLALTSDALTQTLARHLLLTRKTQTTTEQTFHLPNVRLLPE
jgi:hypothetical protein